VYGFAIHNRNPGALDDMDRMALFQEFPLGF
jgi:hypothetical protein